MGQKKLIRFNEIKAFENVMEYPEHVAGQWAQYFKNENPITLELACGKGEYTVGLSRLFPHQNFIGIDLKGNRIWKGAKTALGESLSNVAFIRSHIDKVNNYFTQNEISEIWITFPDPQLRNSKMKKRLTHPRFLRLYQSILKHGGKVHLKTDSPDLYSFTKLVCDLHNLDILVDYNDVYAQPNLDATLKIKTHYEGLNISGSGKIFYLQFNIDKTIAIEKDAILKQMFTDTDDDATGES